MGEDSSLENQPPEMTVDVWIIDLDSPLSQGADFDKILSEDERNRAQGFLCTRDAQRFRVCHAALRQSLAWYLRQAPERIALTRSAKGKPGLNLDSRLRFNVAHSARLGIMAFTTVGDIGVDIEAIRYNLSAADIASRNFTKKEAALVAAAGTPQHQVRTFLRIWTRKEAVFKAFGCGISLGLDVVDVSHAKENVVRLGGKERELSNSWWVVRDLELTDGFLAAIAAPKGNWKTRQRVFRAEDVIWRRDNCLSSWCPPC